jgi:putative oxidoreductase
MIISNIKIKYLIERLLSIVAAIILLQTLYFKFTAAPVSVHIFSTSGIESWGRIGTGVMELLAGILLLWQRTSMYGALLALGIMAGAILSHVFFLGIEILGDGGHVFILAIIVTVCSLRVLITRFDDIKSLINMQFYNQKNQ